MKKYPASKSAKVIAFLKANSAEISHAETVKPRGKKVNLNGKPSKGNSRKAS
jgi:hypothetical protein